MLMSYFYELFICVVLGITKKPVELKLLSVVVEVVVLAAGVVTGNGLGAGIT